MLKKNLHIIFYFVIIILMITNYSFKDIKDSTFSYINYQNINKAEKKAFLRDATRLSLRHIAKGTPFEDLQPNIPTEIKDELYQALLAIQQSEISEAQLVNSKYKLHTFPNPQVDRIQVKYKNTATWSKPLKISDKDFTTDSEIINQICTDYNLKISQNEIWNDDYSFFILEAKEPVNMSSIAKMIKTEEDIEDINFFLPNFDGNDLEAIKTANGWIFNFMIKFDACFTGCKKKRVWSFEAKNIKKEGANIIYLGVSGDELPAWMKK